MGTFAFKLAAAPILVGAASLASRRWGQAIGGWLIALPLTSGPVVFFLALERGTQFASIVARGCLGGAIAESAFCLGYIGAARRSPWPQAFLSGALSFALLTTLLIRLNLRIIPVFLLVVAVVGGTLWLVPSVRISGCVVRPRWDIPFRMMAATTAILLLTAAATVLGATLSGILSVFPVQASTLTISAHRSDGWQASAQVLRGLLYGLLAYAVFFLTLSLLIINTTLPAAFLFSEMIALVVQGGSLWAIRHEGSTQEGR